MVLEIVGGATGKTLVSPRTFGDYSVILIIICMTFYIAHVSD